MARLPAAAAHQAASSSAASPTWRRRTPTRSSCGSTAPTGTPTSVRSRPATSFASMSIATSPDVTARSSSRCGAPAATCSHRLSPARLLAAAGTPDYRRCSGAALNVAPLCSDGSVELKVGSVILPPSHGYRWLGYGEDATADLPGWVIERWRGERYRRWREHGRVPAVADAADLLDRIVRLTGRPRDARAVRRLPVPGSRRPPRQCGVRMSDHRQAVRRVTLV